MKQTRDGETDEARFVDTSAVPAKALKGPTITAQGDALVVLHKYLSGLRGRCGRRCAGANKIPWRLEVITAR